jgi:uncharacterized protein (TIGR02118 family)
VKAKPILWLVSMNFNAPEKEEEFNKWYNETHVPDALKAPGIIRGNRYVAIRAREGQPKYLAIYEVESEEAIDSILVSPEMGKAKEDFHARWALYTSDRSSFWYKLITT